MITNELIETILNSDEFWDNFLKKEGLSDEDVLIKIFKSYEGYSEEMLLDAKRTSNANRIKKGKKPLFPDV